MEIHDLFIYREELVFWKFRHFLLIVNWGSLRTGLKNLSYWCLANITFSKYLFRSVQICAGPCRMVLSGNQFLAFFIKKGDDIIFLQETHASILNETFWGSQWGGHCRFSSVASNSSIRLVELIPHFAFFVINLMRLLSTYFVTVIK